MADLAHQPFWSIVQIAPRETKHGPASEHERVLTLSIALERRQIEVEGFAVGLDADAAIGVGEVELVALTANDEREPADGPSEAWVIQQPGKARFEHARRRRVAIDEQRSS